MSAQFNHISEYPEVSIAQQLLWKSCEVWLEKFQKEPPFRSFAADDCPLCGEYNCRQWEDGHTLKPICEGCPIYNYTNRRGCYNTPYVEASDAHKNIETLCNWDIYEGNKWLNPKDTPITIKLNLDLLIWKEYEFLVSLALGENPPLEEESYTVYVLRSKVTKEFVAIQRIGDTWKRCFVNNPLNAVRFDTWVDAYCHSGETTEPYCIDSRLAQDSKD